MNRPLFRTIVLALTMTVTGIGVIGCTQKVEGKYSDPNDVMTIEFKSGGKAYLTLPIGGTMEGDYTVDGKNVVVDTHSPVGKIVFTRNDDGTLSGGPAGSGIVKLTKKT